MTDPIAMLLQQVKAIEPSYSQTGIRLYPCSARLLDNTALECVYFIAPEAVKRLFGFARVEEIPGIAWISPSQVATVTESPSRLPVRFANQIYRAGESRMGGCLFTLVFSRWRRRKYLTGNFVDFLEFPWGTHPSDVKEVILHRGASRVSRVPECKWCVLPTSQDTLMAECHEGRT